MKKTMMRKYAQLTVKTGVNIKKGQGAVIFAQVEQHEFAEMVAEEAYRAGAKWVHMQWQDQDFNKLQFRHESVTQRSRVEEWEKAQQQFIVDELPVRISIVSADPDGLKGINVDKMQKINAARGKVLKPYRDAIENKHQWTIVAVPSKKWAKKVFPGERTSTAVEKLWEVILKTVRVTEDNDPQAEWDKHNRTIIEKCEKLTAYDFDYLHYESQNGTDFKCWLIPGGKWNGGGETLIDGTFFNPNMPTEEAFTSPLKGKCEGTLVATLPLSYQGNLIDKFSITFKDGKAVSCKAEQGQALLEKMIAMDEGASMLGELALVPDDSPISNSGILFYNTLFDENAACHVALGMGFNDTIPGFAGMSKEEIQAKGINDSIIHVDFMVGSKELNVTGYTRDGKAVPVLRNGNWAI
ncbi:MULTISPECIES: aminopeptidase [Eubacteriales]|uniref:aminopeptidase n=1 Tax=Eubacteriales TaxID=186802 RepID=UPI00136A4372|nr:MULTISPECIES: aminopeptidase [unclassified Neglectibacter]NBI16405.1 aminopeptidase [Neglectibacter sp. 59]NBJ72103.1 aminopeptidase [Neglectibacter sp. X4]NCE79879.1 aminopeptidase [Neglectibacter sp. X58]